MFEKEMSKKMLNTFIQVKASMCDTADPSVKVRLDEVIDQLQSMIEGKEPEDPTKVLGGLAKFLKMLPGIATLISLLSD